MLMIVQEGSVKRKSRWWLSLLLYIAIVVIVALCVKHFVIQKVKVDGPSMQETLYTNDELLVEKVSYRLRNPKLYDIIVFRPYENNQDTYYIKRIIGVPGDFIEIKEGKVFRNFEALDDPQGEEFLYDPGIVKDGIQLEEDEYFVLGDNRYKSTDSRSSSVGLVKRNSILGRAFVRIWPFDKIGFIN